MFKSLHRADGDDQLLVRYNKPKRHMPQRSRSSMHQYTSSRENGAASDNAYMSEPEFGFTEDWRAPSRASTMADDSTTTNGYSIGRLDDYQPGYSSLASSERQNDLDWKRVCFFYEKVSSYFVDEKNFLGSK